MSGPGGGKKVPPAPFVASPKTQRTPPRSGGVTPDAETFPELPVLPPGVLTRSQSSTSVKSSGSGKQQTTQAELDEEVLAAVAARQGKFEPWAAMSEVCGVLESGKLSKAGCVIIRANFENMARLYQKACERIQFLQGQLAERSELTRVLEGVRKEMYEVTSMFAGSVEGMRGLLAETSDFLANAGMRLSVAKCLSFWVEKRGDAWVARPTDLSLDGQPVRCCSVSTPFDYLGLTYTLARGFNNREHMRVLEQAVERARKLSLKPQQKVQLVMQYIVPTFAHRLTIDPPSSNDLL